MHSTREVSPGGTGTRGEVASHAEDWGHPRKYCKWGPQSTLRQLLVISRGCVSFQLQFSRCQLMELYSAFIQNFMRAKAAVEVAKHSRPDFAKLLEVSGHG